MAAEGDRLDVLREVDEVFINSIREWGLYDKIWQAFAVFLPVRSVGERPPPPPQQRTQQHTQPLPVCG